MYVAFVVSDGAGNRFRFIEMLGVLSVCSLDFIVSKLIASSQSTTVLIIGFSVFPSFSSIVGVVLILDALCRASSSDELSVQVSSRRDGENGLAVFLHM